MTNVTQSILCKTDIHSSKVNQKEHKIAIKMHTRGGKTKR